MGKQNNETQCSFITVTSIIVIKEKVRLESDQLDVKFWICAQPLGSQLGSNFLGLQEVRDHIYF